MAAADTSHAVPGGNATPPGVPQGAGGSAAAAATGAGGGAAPLSPAVPGVVNDAGLIIADVPCRKCSYSLRGMNVTARCPECGAPAGIAVHGPLIRYGDPQWVRNLARGANFAFWGLILSVLIAFVLALLLRALGQQVAAVLGLAGGLVYLFGAWLLTEPDPSGIGEDQYGTVRRTIRVALVVGLAQNLVSIAGVPSVASPALTVALGVLSVAAGLAGVVGQFAVLRYLERLTGRIPNAKLSARARFLFWAYGGSTAAVVVLGGLAGIAGYLSTRGGTGATGGMLSLLIGLGCLTGVGVLAIVVFGVMFVMLLGRLRAAFEEQAEYAALAWARLPQ